MKMLIKIFKNWETLVVIILAFFFVGAGMMKNILPAINKPADRLYNGLEGYVDDYVGYVSYVQEGMDGLNTFRIRSLPPPQPATTGQLIYVWAGKVGKIFGWDAPLTYHALRVIGGFFLFFAMYDLFVFLFGSRKMGLLASILAGFSGTVGWYIRQNGTFIYQTFATFGFIDNVALRFASRPHYLWGAALFLVITKLCLEKIQSTVKIVAIFILSLILATMHPSFAMLLGAIVGVMTLLELVRKKSLKVIYSGYTISALGIVLGIGLSYLTTHQYPYTWILAFEEYVRYERLIWDTIKGDLISFGPLLWLGFPGLVLSVIFAKNKRERPIYMLVWLLVQLGFFFFFYKFFRTERVRYIQSLYFIPTAYGTLEFLKFIAKYTRKWIIVCVSGILVTIMISTFINGYKTSLTEVTNYSYYSLFAFPTPGMIEAYKWLDKNTPPDSMVIAVWEAANNIIMYSHNYVIGNPEGWPGDKRDVMMQQKDEFFTGSWNETITRKYLKMFNIKYVYKGYQETDGFLKYPLYKPVFSNTDVTIYQVVL
jgi:hypothetical protein